MKNNHSETASEKEYNFKGGFRNALIVILFAMCLIHVFENYSQYGIIHTPLEILYFFAHFIYRTYWVYVVVLIGFFLQLVISITLENLLLKQIISERLGIILHIFNTLLMMNTIGIISTFYKYNSAAAGFITGLNFNFLFKFWSFAAVNKEYRLKYLKENSTVENKETSTIKMTNEYPKNLSISNLLKFVTGSGNFIYSSEEIKKFPRNYVGMVKKIVGMFIVVLTSAFIMYQYIFPNLAEMVESVDSACYFKAYQSLLKVLFPIIAVHTLTFYYFPFIFYLPLLTEIWGFKPVCHMKDWWNSKNAAEYWTLWNIEGHYFFKKHVFTPMLEMGYTRSGASSICLLISGLLHEYIIGISLRTCYGLSTSAMLGQIGLISVTTKIQKKYGSNLGNFSFLFLLYNFLIITMGQVYYCYVHKNYGPLQQQ